MISMGKTSSDEFQERTRRIEVNFDDSRPAFRLTVTSGKEGPAATIGNRATIKQAILIVLDLPSPCSRDDSYALLVFAAFGPRSQIGTWQYVNL
jgi:hypothetical protein